VPNDNEDPNFYLLKFLEESNTKSRDLSWKDPGNLTGRIYLIDSNNEYLVAQQYQEGALQGNISSISEENLEAFIDGKQRAVQDCSYYTTHYYTDTYIIYGDGSREHIGRTYQGSSTEVVCTGSSGGGGGNRGGYDGGSNGGGGSTGGGSGGGSGNCGDPAHGCFDRDEVIDEIVSFHGEIDASDLANHPKADCIYGKLSSTNTVKNVVSKFAGKSTNFDLMIEVGDVEDNDPGTLISSSNTNTFTMRIDEEGLLQRKPIETAVTFMHEAIHAEMRRFLYNYEAEQSTSLPGFPGDFTADWQTYIEVTHGGDPELGEHEVMAAKYRSVIVDAIKAYDNNALSREEYEALAWNGLVGTKYYRDGVSVEDKTKYSENYQKAIRNTTDSCN
jgi:hypothetical protein